MNSKPVIQIGDILLVEVPEDARVFYLTSGGIAGRKLLCFKGEQVLADPVIPFSGPWQIIGLAKDISEEVAKGLVEKEYASWVGMRFKNYANSIYFSDTGLESLASLLKAHNLEPNCTVILKKGK